MESKTFEVPLLWVVFDGCTSRALSSPAASRYSDGESFAVEFTSCLPAALAVASSRASFARLASSPTAPAAMAPAFAASPPSASAAVARLSVSSFAVALFVGLWGIGGILLVSPEGTLSETGSTGPVRWVSGVHLAMFISEPHLGQKCRPGRNSFPHFGQKVISAFHKNRMVAFANSSDITHAWEGERLGRIERVQGAGVL